MGCRKWAERAVRNLFVNGQWLALPPALLLLAGARAELDDEAGATRARRRAHALLAEISTPAVPEASPARQHGVSEAWQPRSTRLRRRSRR